MVEKIMIYPQPYCNNRIKAAVTDPGSDADQAAARAERAAARAERAAAELDNLNFVLDSDYIPVTQTTNLYVEKEVLNG